VLRLVLAAGFLASAVILLVLAFPSGFLTVPLGVLFGGLGLALFRGDYDERPGGVARWTIRIGLGLFLLEVAAFLAIGLKNWL
jgi:hypothetical protein